MKYSFIKEWYRTYNKRRDKNKKKIITRRIVKHWREYEMIKKNRAFLRWENVVPCNFFASYYGTFIHFSLIKCNGAMGNFLVHFPPQLHCYVIEGIIIRFIYLKKLHRCLGCQMARENITVEELAMQFIRKKGHLLIKEGMPFYSSFKNIWWLVSYF